MSDINILTDFPIAYDSPDHLVPLGTKKDDSGNLKFVKRCENWLRKHRKIKNGKILDIGCAGGRCVEDFVKRGHDAYGIEGSDYSKKNNRASWSSIPERLFTCDASQYFKIIKNDTILLFDIIISFEVMEHIKKINLKTYFQNIYSHLDNNGLFVGTFTTTKSKKFPDHHQTIMCRSQWFNFIKNLNMFTIIDLKWKRKEYLRHSKLKTNCIPISFVKSVNTDG